MRLAASTHRCVNGRMRPLWIALGFRNGSERVLYTQSSVHSSGMELGVLNRIVMSQTFYHSCLSRKMGVEQIFPPAFCFVFTVVSRWRKYHPRSARARRPPLFQPIRLHSHQIKAWQGRAAKQKCVVWFRLGVVPPVDKIDLFQKLSQENVPSIYR